MGLVQLSKQILLNKKRSIIAKKYNDAFCYSTNIVTPFVHEDRKTSWHLYVILVDKRANLISELSKAGISCSVHFIPIHKLTYYAKLYKYNNSDYEVANMIYSRTLSLPIFPDMTEIQVDYVIEHVLRLVKNK